MTRKDAASLTISVFALLISGITTYYSLLRVRHDSSVVVGDNYGIFTDFEGRGLTSYATDGDLVFVNNGTRPIAVIGLSIILYHVAKIERQRKDCAFAKDVNWRTARAKDGFAPFVVAAQDVKIIRPTFASDPSGQSVGIARVGENPNYIFEAKGREETPTFVSCLRIEFVPAGGKVQSTERVLFNTVGEGTSPGPFHGSIPIDLIKKTELPW